MVTRKNDTKQPDTTQQLNRPTEENAQAKALPERGNREVIAIYVYIYTKVIVDQK